MIINKPSLQTLRQRFGYSFLTVLFWMFWFYLWLPLISIVAWLVGIEIFYQEMIVAGGHRAFFELVGFYSQVVLSITVVFLGWAGYNLFRFRGKKRRKGSKVIEMTEIAGRFSVDAGQLMTWRRAKRLVIHHDAHGTITRVDQEQVQVSPPLPTMSKGVK